MTDLSDSIYRILDNDLYTEPPCSCRGVTSVDPDGKQYAVRHLVELFERLMQDPETPARHVPDIDPFPDRPEFNELFSRAVAECNGFVYAGDLLNGQIELIKWLRRHPDAAQRLLADYA